MQNKKAIANMSVNKWYDPFISTLIVVVGYFWLAESELTSVTITMILAGLTIIYFFGIELYRRNWNEKNIQVVNKVLFLSILTKYLGIIFGIALILFAYWIFPEYAQAKYINPINSAKYTFLTFFLPLCLILVSFTEYYLGPKKDNTYQFGLLVLGKLEEIDWKKFRDGILEWTVRLVFLTLNFTSSVTLMNKFRNTGIDWSNFASAVISLESFIFFIILLVIIPGYVFSSRLINTEVKKIDSSWFAWTVLLICYQPFISPIFRNLFGYGPDLEVFGGSPAWIGLTRDIPMLLYVAGAGIVAMALVHLWAEAMIGIRSSNVTNRGIITNGPFLITKHPVYVSKIIGWAIIAMPFLNGATTLGSIRLGILFLGVCAIYAARSLSEEKLLSTDETYVKYALYMDKHGWFSFVGKLFPVMSFEWRLNYWRKTSKL